MMDDRPLFSVFSPEDIKYLCNCGVTKSYEKNALLIREGDRSDSVYFIIEGQVKVYLSDIDGNEALLNTQGPGTYVGELAFIDDEPRSASVSALTPVQITMVTRAAFEKCLTHNPLLAIKLIRALAQRLRALTKTTKGLALSDVYGRLAELLRQLAVEHEGIQVIEQRLTQQDIAARIGASREMVGRIMKDLINGGYIKMQDKLITIPSKLPPAW